jgi:hypothetical protein
MPQKKKVSLKVQREMKRAANYSSNIDKFLSGSAQQLPQGVWLRGTNCK